MGKILIVDDNNENLELLEAFLLLDNYKIIKASNGQEGFDYYIKYKPDIVITDIMMPQIDGFTLCKMIKEIEGVYTPVIIITALQDHDEKIRGLESGADEFLTKPINHVELRTRIKSLLKQKKLNDKLTEAYQRLEKQNKKLQWELEMAKYIQQLLLPKKIDVPQHWSIVFKYLPVYSLGGDFFDLIEIDQDNLGVFISDVSGHGAGAAMLTVAIKTILDGISKEYLYHPKSVLQQVNKNLISILERDDNGTFVTALYGVLNHKKNTIRISGAGHPYPIIINRKEKKTDFIETKGYPLGIIDGAVYEEIVFVINDDSGILFYTDGLYELQNKEGDFFGIEGLKDFMQQNIDLKNNLLVDKLLNYVIDNHDLQKDDINIILLEKKNVS